MPRNRIPLTGGNALVAEHNLYDFRQLVPSAGNLFFVDSGASASGTGLSPEDPVTTLAAAVALCTANNGDVIFLLEGHNEGMGNAQIALSVAGITIIGLGSGSARPRFDYDHANASIDITASGIALKNITLLPSVTDVAIGIDVNAAVTDTLIEDVESLPGEDGGGVDDFVIGIDIKAGCTRTTIRRYKQRQHASGVGYAAGIKLTGASDDVFLDEPNIVLKGTAAVAPINGITTLSTNLRIRRGYLVSDDEPGIELLTGTTGAIQDTDIFTDMATIAAATVADGMAHFRVRYVEVGNESDAAVKTASADD